MIVDMIAFVMLDCFLLLSSCWLGARLKAAKPETLCVGAMMQQMLQGWAGYLGHSVQGVVLSLRKEATTSSEKVRQCPSRMWHVKHAKHVL